MLKLVQYEKETQKLLKAREYHPEAHIHHQYLIDEYLRSHRIRNHSAKTIKKNEVFLISWFKDHGNYLRPLFVWEAMEPVVGRQRVVNYGQNMIDLEIANQTIRNYLGMLQGFFSFVLSRPFVMDMDRPINIADHYNRIEQPISEYEIPVHSLNRERKGIPLDPERIIDFLKVVRDHYLGYGRYPHLNARDYAMAVMAAETGLRVDELVNIDIERDLFFESKKVQTRWAKSSRGSGKKARVTLFPPLTRDTLRYYIKNHRPHIKGYDSTTTLFISRGGRNMSYSQIHRFLKKMVKISNANGVFVANHFSPHWFRKIFATNFIERFPDQLQALIMLLGHSGPSTVGTYIRHSEAWKDQKIKETLERVEFNDNTMEL